MTDDRPASCPQVKVVSAIAASGESVRGESERMVHEGETGKLDVLGCVEVAEKPPAGKYLKGRRLVRSPLIRVLTEDQGLIKLDCQ